MNFFLFIFLSLGIHSLFLFFPFFKSHLLKEEKTFLFVVDRVTEIKTQTFSPLKSGRHKNSSENIQKLIEGNPKPIYPPLAKRLGLMGKAIVSVFVSKDGKIQKILFHQRTGHSLLDQSILNTVKTWKIPHSQKKDFWLKLPPFVFKLKKDSQTQRVSQARKSVHRILESIKNSRFMCGPPGSHTIEI